MQKWRSSPLESIVCQIYTNASEPNVAAHVLLNS